jgi:sec-independent protein translocase protein TatA
MFANLSGWHLLIILAVVLLLFGATRLPALSRSVGQSVRIFRSETKNLNEESDSTPTGTDPDLSTPGRADRVDTSVAPHASPTGV